MAAALIFVDGVGIGDRNPAYNPLAREVTLLSQFTDGSGTALPRGGRVAALDAALGVSGRPQSATGHTTLLTGENAQAQLGRHLLGFPNPQLRRLLEERSIFAQLRHAGRRFSFLNGYPKEYLALVGLPYQGKEEEAPVELPPGKRSLFRPAAAPYAFASAGGLLATFAEVKAGRALCHDLTHRLAQRRDPELLPRTPDAAAEIFVAAAGENDFVMFDYFLTDEAGHAQDFDAARQALADLDGFLRAVVERLDLERTSLLVVSDHGNLEDLRRRNHTLAAVPLLAFGPAAQEPLPQRLDRVCGLLLRMALS